MMMTASGAFATQYETLVANGDQRDANPTPAQIANWTNAQFAEQMHAMLSSGPLEVFMVGDISVEEAINQISRTFGTIKKRAAAAAPGKSSNRRTFPAGRAKPVELFHYGPPEQALGYVAWPTIDQARDAKEARKVRVLADVMGNRIRAEIREKQGLAYSPDVGPMASETFDRYGYLEAQAETTPSNIQSFFKIVDEIAKSLRTAEPTQDEMDRAKRPLLAAVRENQGTNQYWIDQLPRVKRRGIGPILNHLSDYEAVTAADVRAAAQKYLLASKRWRATVTKSAELLPAASP